MRVLIVSGLSGAGKTQAAGILEDMGFYCVDNMPVQLMPKFAELCLSMHGIYERVALVTDIRGRDSFDMLFFALDEMKSMGCDYEILFIEASTEAIVKRYKETRRRHPLDPEGSDLESAVMREKRILSVVRERADYNIDTSSLTIAQLQKEISGLFLENGEKRLINVNLLSFGFKHGLPMTADMVLDVRFLPNPYYVPSLSALSGLNRPVADFVLQSEDAQEFIKKTDEMLEFLLPRFIEEGKRSITIAIGCTGGRHRSVAIAERIAAFAEEKGYPTETRHRDIDK